MKKINSRELELLKVVDLIFQFQHHLCSKLACDEFVVEFDSSPFKPVDERNRYRVNIYFRDDNYWTCVIEESLGNYTPIEIIKQFEPSIYERKSK